MKRLSSTDRLPVLTLGEKSPERNPLHSTRLVGSGPKSRPLIRAQQHSHHVAHHSHHGVRWWLLAPRLPKKVRICHGLSGKAGASGNRLGGSFLASWKPIFSASEEIQATTPRTTREPQEFLPLRADSCERDTIILCRFAKALCICFMLPSPSSAELGV